MTNKTRQKKQQVLTTNQIRDYLVNLDKLEKIDLSKVFNAVHFERIINYIYTQSQTPYFTLEELLESESLERMVKSRHYDWIRPEGAITYDQLTFDFTRISEKERQDLLSYPRDQLKELVRNYLKYNYRLRISPKAEDTLSEFFTDQFANEQIYDKSLWDSALVRSIARNIEVWDD